jgi:hypothetical protein
MELKQVRVKATLENPHFPCGLLKGSEFDPLTDIQLIKEFLVVARISKLQSIECRKSIYDGSTTPANL